MRPVAFVSFFSFFTFSVPIGVCSLLRRLRLYPFLPHCRKPVDFAFRFLHFRLLFRPKTLQTVQVTSARLSSTPKSKRAPNSGDRFVYVIQRLSAKIKGHFLSLSHAFLISAFRLQQPNCAQRSISGFNEFPNSAQHFLAFVNAAFDWFVKLSLSHRLELVGDLERPLALNTAREANVCKKWDQ
ncbi:hypothetical protein L596_021098 [Steinernema carpocapsae]|uniref:Uncharacterized protein n=1 Tax=Steinernema carpocapsae TaxID=34508 RepID=A0A4U5MVH4_STECR|nr:hypothetical protein L596_021098 [Steinernema carpocapsae]